MRRSTQVGPAASHAESYAPPVSGAELRSARVGATLGRPVNAAEVVFFSCFFFFVFLDFWFYCFFWFFVLFSFLFFFFLTILNIFSN
jgi:hypothetical protein